MGRANFNQMLERAFRMLQSRKIVSVKTLEDHQRNSIKYKEYKDTKEKMLTLTCTEQLQKWHK